MFSSQGQVSSKVITFLVDREKSNIFGRRVETAKNTDTANIPSKPNCKFQPEAECNMPRKYYGKKDIKRLMENVLREKNSYQQFKNNNNKTKLNKTKIIIIIKKKNS